MMEDVVLKTVSDPLKYEENIRRSIFICSISPAENVESACDFISKVSQEYRNATHNCWAYRIFENQTVHEAYSDAGEPSGTAGRPMLDALKKHGIVNVAVVVTRYFGGIKLGKRGLIEAYSGVVERALAEAEKAPLLPMNVYLCDTDYSEFERIRSRAEKSGGRILSASYSDRVKFEVAVPRSHVLEKCVLIDTRLVKLR